MRMCMTYTIFSFCHSSRVAKNSAMMSAHNQLDLLKKFDKQASRITSIPLKVLVIRYRPTAAAHTRGRHSSPSFLACVP